MLAYLLTDLLTYLLTSLLTYAAGRVDDTRARVVVDRSIGPRAGGPRAGGPRAGGPRAGGRVRLVAAAHDR